MMISIMATGCLKVNVGTQKVEVLDHYPVYPVVKSPTLQNLTAVDMDPHLDAVSVARKAMEDGTVTVDEAEFFEMIMKKAEKSKWEAVAKKKSNDELLIRWGRKNQATIESYNKYAAERNEVAARSKIR